ncbi:unnamed protein product [Tilletia caries]|uniref:UBA domain-containing protein n=3 Tax=Tilletia TaxID=13289 RepID=A0A8X7SUQ8_9BASI|nr:hypothetical protein CF336_g8089 [Tilletia laevis]KAE8183894.1 hypothetical protein CF335_g8185 [Tilletia laevis]KAE8187480.1 hypothetical protein CF328_g6902 [Tilletia controversa]KAE8243453.1 hypothetical protein A4X06_0g6307 [Tilletia controversa]CAD6898573.1 unnamed protein product [Tilletia caries]
MTDDALQRGATMYSRFRPGSKQSATTAKPAAKGGEHAPPVVSDASPTLKDYTVPPAAAATSDESEPLSALLQMGFSPLEAHDALRRKGGDLPAAIEDLVAQDGAKVKELAMSTPLPVSPPVYEHKQSPLTLSDTKSKTPETGVSQATSTQGKDASPAATQPSATPTSAPTPASSAATPKKAPLKVVGGEAMENPHWTQKARQAVESATSSEFGKIAAAQVLNRSHAFLSGGGEGAKPASSAGSSSKGKLATAGWGMIGGSSKTKTGQKTDAGAVKRSKSVAGETSRRT